MLSKEKKKEYQREYMRQKRSNNTYRNRERSNSTSIKYVKFENKKEIIIQQGSKCAICNELMPENKLYLDHNHKNGEYRGFLCPSCNTGIGLLKDDINILKKAIDYITSDGILTKEQKDKLYNSVRPVRPCLECEKKDKRIAELKEELINAYEALKTEKASLKKQTLKKIIGDLPFSKDRQVQGFNL